MNEYIFRPDSSELSIRQHTSAGQGTSTSSAPTALSLAYVSIRQHTSAYVSIRQHTSAYVSRSRNEYIFRHDSSELSIRQHTSAYVSIRQQVEERVHLPPRQL
jgi:hypothetical protein